MNSGPRIHAGQSGMTLVELVVVLALMASLATLMLTGASDLNNRGRYDETTTRMRLIRDAVVGEGGRAGRFVQDMGRLPIVKSTTGGEVLSELWRPGTTPVFSGAVLPAGTSWPAGDPAPPLSTPDRVELPCGWNGPYITVDDPGTARMYDGFGNDFLVYDGSDWTANINDTIEIISSPGSDCGVDVGTPAWDEADRELILKDGMPKTELQVSIKARDTSAGTAVWRPLSLPTQAWAGTRETQTGNWVRNVANTHVFTCTTAGNTGDTEPAWDTGLGGTTHDNNVVWTCIGTTAEVRRCLRIALWIPAVGNNSKHLDWIRIDDDNDARVPSTVLMDDSRITPGVRGIYAYAFLRMDNARAATGYLCSPGQDAELVKLHPGLNHVTLYLTEQR